MYTIAVYVSFAAMMLGTLYYGVFIAKGKFTPPPAAFLILSASFGLSWFMYTETPSWTWTGNIGLLGAVVSVFGLTITIVITLLAKKEFLVSFTRFQKWMMVGAGYIVLFWLVTDDPFWSYVLLQVLGFIGYIPIIVSLYLEQHNDSLILWGSIWLSVVVALYPALQRADIEAYIYIARALLGTTTVVVLLIRIRLKKRISQTA